MKKHDFSRRRFLRGTGGASIGLPFLLAREGDTRAQVGSPPERLVTLFFAHGMPLPLTANGYEGVLAPLKPHAPKLTMVRQLNCYANGPGNGHVKGSAGFACGMDSPGSDTKGGPSLDWVAYKAFGADTPLATLSAGLDGNDEPNERMRFVHSWRGVKQPNEPFLEPIDMFNSVFGPGAGTGPGGVGPDPAVAKRARQRTSVLDAVMTEYRSFVSEASGYSKGVRTLVADHMETVRELEKRAIAQSTASVGGGPAVGSAPAPACVKPAAPPQLNVTKSPRPETWEKAWPLMVEIYAVALKCDLVRFGNLMDVAGGAPFPFTGVSGSSGNVHSGVMHRYPSASATPLALEAFTWLQARVAHVLATFDDPRYREANGATLLENMTLFIGTELSEPATHLNTDMTFWIAGGRNRFKRGIFTIGGGHSDVDLYATLLKGIGLGTLKFGDQRYFKGELPILA